MTAKSRLSSSALSTVLEYLHTRQPPLIFRDIKPANIIRTAEVQAVATAYISHALASLLPPPYGWPLPRNQRTHRAVQVLRERIAGFIAERRSKPLERDDFLSILLRARDEECQAKKAPLTR